MCNGEKKAWISRLAIVIIDDKVTNAHVRSADDWFARKQSHFEKVWDSSLHAGCCRMLQDIERHYDLRKIAQFLPGHLNRSSAVSIDLHLPEDLHSAWPAYRAWLS